MGNIVDALREHKLRSIKRSVQYTEQREAATERHAQLAKSVISGKPLESSLTLEANTLRTLYYEMLRDYKGGSHFNIPGPVTKRGAALWTRVEAARKRAGVDAKTFLRAQFAWFDKNFGRPPQLPQLTTDAAVERVAEVGTIQMRRIVGAGVEAKVDKAAVFRQSEKLLQDMMRAQKCDSREEFYREFVLSGVFTFPKDFLNADPAYRRACVVS